MKKTKEIFSVIGEAKEIDGTKRFVAKSTKYLADQIQRLPLNKLLTLTFSASIPSRSEQQNKYHHVLVEYVAQHTGYTHDEMHDWIMREKFGIKEVTVNGKKHQVRKSIAKVANLPMEDAEALITYDLELCESLGIRVPSKEELGYLPSSYVDLMQTQKV